MGKQSNIASVTLTASGHKLAILNIVKAHKLMLNFQIKNSIYLYIIQLSDLTNIDVI